MISAVSNFSKKLERLDKFEISAFVTKDVSIPKSFKKLIILSRSTVVKFVPVSPVISAVSSFSKKLERLDKFEISASATKDVSIPKSFKKLIILSRSTVVKFVPVSPVISAVSNFSKKLERLDKFEISASVTKDVSIPKSFKKLIILSRSTVVKFVPVSPVISAVSNFSKKLERLDKFEISASVTKDVSIPKSFKN